MDCRNDDVGVIGERKDNTTSTSLALLECDGIMYVKFVVEASKVAPRYEG